MSKKFFVALAVSSLSVMSQAATQYNFWFQISDGYTENAYVLWDANSSAIVGGGGALVSTNKPAFNGSLTSFKGNSLNQFTYQLSSTGSTVYEVDFSGAAAKFPAGNYVYYEDEVGNPTLYGLQGSISPLGTVYGKIAPGAVGGVQVPEIDGDKLPQVALLIGGLFLAYRSRNALKLSSGSMAQPA
jgi:hypothetical protein